MTEGHDENVVQPQVAQPAQPPGGETGVASEAGTNADDNLDIEIQPAEPIGNIQLGPIEPSQPVTPQPAAETNQTAPVAQVAPPPPPPPASVETSPEKPPDQLLEAEKKAEREEKLTELIEEFANISEEDLKQYDAFREKTKNEKFWAAAKGLGRRAAVYTAFGVGAYAFLHAAPLAIVAGAAAGLGGSTLSRGVVDMVKWASGAEKKEQALRGQISEKQMDKLNNLMALATSIKQIEGMLGQQAMNPENNQIITLEEAKFNFIKALVDLNNKAAAENVEIEGLKKKYDKSRKDWSIAKTVASVVGGLAGGVTAAYLTELKTAVANKVAEEGIKMHGRGLGEIAPHASREHLVHLHKDELVFNYKPGELETISKAIAAKPELAHSFATTVHTKELISQGMHQAGNQIMPKFVESVNEVAGTRIAEFATAAAVTAEAADRVWNAISHGRSEEERELSKVSKYGKKNLEQYQGDLQAGINSGANERFQSMFPGVALENMPAIGQEIHSRIEMSLEIRDPDGSTRELTINSGDSLLIQGPDQNGNIIVTLQREKQPLSLTPEQFSQMIAATEAGPTAAEVDKKILVGNSYPAKIKSKIDGTDNEFIVDIDEIDRKLIIKNITADLNPQVGENWEVEIIKGNDHQTIFDVNVVKKLKESEISEPITTEVWNEAQERSRLDNNLKAEEVWIVHNPSKLTLPTEFQHIDGQLEKTKLAPLEGTAHVIKDIDREANRIKFSHQTKRGVTSNVIQETDLDKFLKILEPAYFANEPEEDQVKLQVLKKEWTKQFEPPASPTTGPSEPPIPAQPPLPSAAPPAPGPATPTEPPLVETPAEPVVPPKEEPIVTPVVEPAQIITPPKPPKPRFDNGLRNGERLSPEELEDGDEIFVVKAAGSYYGENGRLENIPPKWFRQKFIFRDFAEGRATLEREDGSEVEVNEGTLATAFSKSDSKRIKKEPAGIGEEIATRTEQAMQLDKEKFFDSYPLQLENGERIEIAPGQVWQWKTGSGKNERTDDFVIENIKLGSQNGELEIKLKGFDPVIRPTVEWSGIFEAGRRLEDTEMKMQKVEAV